MRDVACNVSTTQNNRLHERRDVACNVSQLNDISGAILTTYHILNFNLNPSNILVLCFEVYLSFFFWITINYKTDEDIEVHGKRMVFRMRPECIDLPNEHELFSQNFFKNFRGGARFIQVVFFIIFIVYMLIYCAGLAGFVMACLIDDSLFHNYFFSILFIVMYSVTKIVVILVSISLTLKKNLMARYVLTVISGVILFNIIFNFSGGAFSYLVAIFFWLSLCMALLDIRYE